MNCNASQTEGLYRLVLLKCLSSGLDCTFRTMAHVNTKVNCGFARAAIRSFSEVGQGKHHVNTNTSDRAKKFQALFESITTYGIDPQAFEGYGHREAPFDRHCKQILGLFRKWKPREKKEAYLEAFSHEKWEKLPIASKKRHTLANCKECGLQYRELQTTFPGGHVYEPQAMITEAVEELIADNATSSKSEQCTTRQILSTLQPLYENAYGRSFTDSLSQCRDAGVQKKATKAEGKRLKRKIQRKCRDKISTHLQKSDAIHVLAEGQSISSYKRMRLAQSFETPEQKAKRFGAVRECGLG